MGKELYDLIIEDQYNSQDQQPATPEVTDTKAVEMYRRNTEGDRGHPPPQCSPNRYKVTRDFEMVFLKNGQQLKKRFTIGPVLDRITKRRLDLGLRKIKEVMIWESSYEGSESISHQAQNPRSIKNFQEGLDDLCSFFKRKKQMMVVLGFIRLGVQQKQILRKRDELERNIGQLRSHQVFAALRDNASGRRDRAVQTPPVFLTRENSESAIHPVDLSGVNIESARQNGRTRKVPRNPFWKIKSGNA